MRRVLVTVLLCCVVVSEGQRDVYVERALRECEETNRTLDCLKYLALDGLQRIAVDPSIEGHVWGKVSIVPAYQPPETTVEDPEIPELQPRAAESEFEGMYGFARRQLERFASTHALSWPSEDVGDSTGITEDGRGKKKKQSMSLLQLLMFLKLKALTVAILVMVTFIKKIVLAGAFFAIFKTLYLKAEQHSTGVEIVHYPQTEQHSWADYGKQHGSSDYSGQDSYGHYEQRRGVVTKHKRIQRDVKVKDTRSRKKTGTKNRDSRLRFMGYMLPEVHGNGVSHY